MQEAESQNIEKYMIIRHDINLIYIGGCKDQHLSLQTLIDTKRLTHWQALTRNTLPCSLPADLWGRLFDLLVFFHWHACVHVTKRTGLLLLKCAVLCASLLQDFISLMLLLVVLIFHHLKQNEQVSKMLLCWFQLWLKCCPSCSTSLLPD